jgi:hypothetical protein
MSKTKKILLGILLLIVVIQFIKPDKNQSEANSPADVFLIFQTPDSTRQLVQTACYDCHSNHTAYPWYAEIQPVAWWLNHHIKEGKSELNFSEFGTYKPKKADHKMKEIVETVEKKEMPLKSYTFIHKNASLTDAQRKVVTDWAKHIRSIIQPDLVKE